MLLGRVTRLSSGEIACPTACVRQPLPLRQVGFAAKQGLLDALALKHFPCQIAVEGRQLAGPFQNTLFELLIQALDFRLSLFVPGGFDNVPTPAALCYGKLMCSHHIQDFSGAASSER